MVNLKKTNLILSLLVVLLLVLLGSWLFLWREYFLDIITPLSQITEDQGYETAFLPESTVRYTNETFNFTLEHPESYTILSEEESVAIEPISREEVDKLILVLKKESSALEPTVTLYVNPSRFESQADRILTTIQRSDGRLMIVGETQYNLEGLETERYVTSAVLSDGNVYSWEMIVKQDGAQAATEFKNMIESFKLESKPEKSDETDEAT